MAKKADKLANLGFRILRDDITGELVSKLAEQFNSPNAAAEAMLADNPNAGVSVKRLAEWIRGHGSWGARSKESSIRMTAGTIGSRGVVLKDGTTKSLWSFTAKVAPTLPKWPVIQPAKPVIVRYPRAKARPSSDCERALIVPDCQIGFWDKDTFHDPRALDIMFQIAEREHFDRAIILGDFIDVETYSKYTQEKEFGGLQPSIDYGYEVLARLRALIHGQIDYIPGNHERRVPEYTLNNAKASMGLRRATDTTGWPVHSIPYLLALDTLKINYVDEYPGGQVWLHPELVCQHANPGSKTDIRASIIHGHTPQYRTEARTIHYQDGPRVFTTHSIPGLMSIEDTPHPRRLIRTKVPSNSSRMNWQQGFAIAHVFAKKRRHYIEPVLIENGVAFYQNELVSAR